MAYDDRFDWALAVLDPDPGDRVLEIGCGVGIAAERVADRLRTGHLTGIDRSASMIDKAEARNARHVSAGRATFLTGTLQQVELEHRPYDKVFAFNVSLFWKRPDEELAVIRSVLADGGALYVFHQPPFDKTKEIADVTVERLHGADYEVLDVLVEPMRPAPSSCVVARPHDRAGR